MFILIVTMLLAGGLVNDGMADNLPLRSSFDMKVFIEPRPVNIGGTPTIVYELHLTNFTQSPLVLKCVSVLESSTDEEIVTMCDDALAGRLSLTGSDKRTINPGIHAVVYLEVEIAGRSMPQALKHRIEYLDFKDHVPNFVEGARVSLNKAPLLVLDPPVSGGRWVAIHSPSWERGHRRVFYAMDGQAHLPGRFAIDWIKLDEQGGYAVGDSDQVRNWHGYGADVLAVAEARVAITRDNIKESETVSAHPPHKLEDATGNYIALDLGNGYFAFYEHLKPGSIRVKPGDRVHSGQVIASLGFTGDSTGPHLHFHLADRNSPLAAEGVPYELKSFLVIGFYSTLDEFGKKPWNPNDGKESRRSSELPASNVVVRFDSSVGETHSN